MLFPIRKKVFCVWLAALALLFPARSLSREITDEIGRTVHLRPEARRIVSLAPGITETLYLLGLEDRIVGVTTFCDWPAAAAQKEKVGGFVNPSVEKIVSLNPDLVLATADGNRRETVRQLEKLRLSVYVINPTDIRGILESIVHIGELTGKKQQAEKLSARLKQRLDRIEAQIKGEKRPRVFFQIGEEPIISVGPKTMIHEAIERAGGINAVGHSAARYPRFSVEGIAAVNPDIILWAPMRGGKETQPPQFFQNKLQTVKAVQQGKIYAVDADLICRASPRAIDAIEQMAELFHPQIRIKHKAKAFDRKPKTKFTR